MRLTTEAVTEPPNKKRKYVPGGIGGGGRWLQPDGVEEMDVADVAKTAPRARSSRPQREHSGMPSMEDGETPIVAR